MVKTTRSIRFDPEALAKAEALGVDVSEVCRKALDRALNQEPVFTFSELAAIDVALRLRAESCEDNLETRKANKWRALNKKFQTLFGGKNV